MQIQEALTALGVTEQTLSQAEKDRLLLQQALLNDNATLAGKLAQTVLAANEAALLAEKNNPFGSWDSGLQTVLNNVRTLQAELAKLGTPEVALPKTTKQATDAIIEGGLGGKAPSYLENFIAGKNTGSQLDTAFRNYVVNVLLDPKDLTTVVTSGQQNTTASGVVVGTSRINKYPAGL
jgi:DNA-binding XRE family transcriptional regulator